MFTPTDERDVEEPIGEKESENSDGEERSESSWHFISTSHQMRDRTINRDSDVFLFRLSGEVTFPFYRLTQPDSSQRYS